MTKSRLFVKKKTKDRLDFYNKFEIVLMQISLIEYVAVIYWIENVCIKLKPCNFVFD